VPPGFDSVARSEVVIAVRCTKRLAMLSVTGVLAVGAGLVGCGEDGGGDGGGGQRADPTASPEDAVTGDQPAATAGESAVEAGDVVLAIETHCDPLEPLVLETLGVPANAEHNDFYANRGEERLLRCAWVAAEREIDVGYNGAPSETMLGFTDGHDVAAIEGPNLFGGFRLDALARNGWTVLVQDLGTDAVQDPDQMARIANAALDLAASP